MINQVYSTVLAIVNKDNRGYISPLEFNLYAELAQMSLFEDIFHKYSRSIVKQNSRMYHSEFADIPKHIREVIDIFVSESGMANGSDFDYTNDYIITANDFYRLIKLDYLPSLSNMDIRNEIEEVSKLEINRVLKNNLSAPTDEYPVYVKRGDVFYVYPELEPKQILATYIRKPKTPKWTYTTVGGNPLFNGSATDYQDFELPDSMFSDLVIKILGYAGIEIREADVIQISQGMEATNLNNEQL